MVWQRVKYPRDSRGRRRNNCCNSSGVIRSVRPCARVFPIQNKPVFITGMTGTGKTVTVQNLLNSLEPPEEEGGQNVVPMTVNFSAQTSSLVTQVRSVAVCLFFSSLSIKEKKWRYTNVQGPHTQRPRTAAMKTLQKVTLKKKHWLLPQDTNSDSNA